MQEQLYQFLDQQKYFCNLQFGFRSNISTSNALMSIIENIQSSLDLGNYTGGMFIDLQKAFNTVNHDILL